MKHVLSAWLIAGCMALALPGCKSKKTEGETSPTGNEKIFALTDKKGDVDKKGPEVKASANITVNIKGLVNEKNTALELPLPNKKTLTLLRRRMDQHEKGRYAWYGTVDKNPGSFALISITPKAIAGKITYADGTTYMISYCGKNIHRIDQVDVGALPERPNDDKEAKVPAGDNGGKDKDCPDASTQVDIMVVYTADAETNAGGPDGMEAFVYLCIYYTNLSYQNSNIDLTMFLVHHQQVTYAETGNEDTDLDALRDVGDGQLDDVHALRDAHGADLVCMITETMGGCGLAFRQYPVTAAWEANAFSVVKRTCAAAGLSFAHETAHNMGARHDCANAGNLAAPNHGHFVSIPADSSGDSWRTVMAYNVCTSGPCNRIPYFSNPNLTYSPTGAAATDPMGTVAAAGVCTNDNTSVINDARPIVANFRCSSPGIDNVWMRDSWNDTGLEPDPATAAEDMWRSPYIWIRHTVQDPTFQHQHQHMNPKMGVSNWIYVKMHNGGVADNGELEIWYANASASLSWPAAWTKLTTVPVNIAAASSKIIEIPWPTLPGSGHYCMVARWSSAADPVTTAETTDIGANTRQNNNIIWRNLNIEEMDPDGDNENVEAFYVQSDDRKPISIRFNDEALFPKPKFTESGKVFITMGENLYAAWKKGGLKGTGIKPVNGGAEIIAPNASLDNIVLPNTERQRVNIKFTTGKKTIPDKYNFTVSQTDASGKKVAGGVSYEIYTYKR